jgi:hypothetical protein
VWVGVQGWAGLEKASAILVNMLVVSPLPVESSKYCLIASMAWGNSLRGARSAGREDAGS